MKTNLKEDLRKALSEPKPETPKIPKPETPKTPKPETPKTPKPETPKTPKPETPKTAKPKPEIRVSEKKLKKLRQDFHESRHKFSKKEIDRYRKAFYVAKSKKYLSKSEKNLMVLTALIMKTFIIMIIIMIWLMMMNIEKLGVLEHYLKN